MLQTKKQIKTCTLKINQKRYVKIVQFLCSKIKIELTIINISRFQAYFVNVAINQIVKNVLI